VKSCYYQIKHIWLIRKYINDENCNTLVQALIISRLDYCNESLYNIPLSLTNHLQLLIFIHWFLVQSRIIFKRCTIAYQTLSPGDPSCLFSTLSLAPKPLVLRSSAFHLLSVPRIKTNAGIRVLSVVVLTL